MSAKVHLHLHVSDLAKSRAFYEKFLGGDPVKVKPGYVIHPDARGKGVVTEALRALVAWVFSPRENGGFGKRRITISTAASNKASRYAAEQAGFTHIATIPTGFTIGPDGFDDEVLYQIVNQNWTPPGQTANPG